MNDKIDKILEKYKLEGEDEIIYYTKEKKKEKVLSSDPLKYVTIKDVEDKINTLAHNNTIHPKSIKFKIETNIKINQI